MPASSASHSVFPVGVRAGDLTRHGFLVPAQFEPVILHHARPTCGGFFNADTGIEFLPPGAA